MFHNVFHRLEKLFHFHSYKSYYNKPNWLSLQRLYFTLKHEIETKLCICWEGDTIFFCGLILCFSIDLRGVGASNISMLDCEIEMNQSWKQGRNPFLVEGCQGKVQNLPCWYLLCVSSKTCTTVRNSVSNNVS